MSKSPFWMGALALVAVALSAPRAADAQLTCTVSNAANCVVGGTAASAITVTVTEASRVTLSSSSVSLPAPNEVSYNNGFGSPGSVQFQVRSNTNWSVAVSSPATFWSSSPVSARADKPVSDLQWSLNSGGPYTDMAAGLATIATGTATGGNTQTLYLRSKYSWAQDLPGSYSIAVQVTLTAP